MKGFIETNIVIARRNVAAFKKNSEFGNLTVIPGHNYAVTFPGYTGDALTHHNFISASAEKGLGIICVTPNWTNSVDDLMQKSELLLKDLQSSDIQLSDVNFLRGVS